MSVILSDLVDTVDSILQPWLFKDYAPNGLQVEGKHSVETIVSGVTACASLLDAAIKNNADVILVHHGYFWHRETPCITGMKQRRIKKLLTHDVSLMAYHLPLDAHPELGNNAQLAKKLDLVITGSMIPSEKNSIGNIGYFKQPMTLKMLGEHLRKTLQHDPLLIEGHQREIKTVAWCTGAAQEYIDHAIARNVDAYISGEISEKTVHIARECGIHYIAAGHHATERYGVQALGAWLQKAHKIKHIFLDIPNPV